MIEVILVIVCAYLGYLKWRRPGEKFWYPKDHA